MNFNFAAPDRGLVVPLDGMADDHLKLRIIRPVINHRKNAAGSICLRRFEQKNFVLVTDFSRWGVCGASGSSGDDERKEQERGVDAIQTHHFLWFHPFIGGCSPPRGGLLF